MSAFIHEKGPALSQAAAEPKTIFSLQKRRLLNAPFAQLLQAVLAWSRVASPSFWAAFASAIITSEVVWLAIFWWWS
jgi:hypothetical protein